MTTNNDYVKVTIGGEEYLTFLDCVKFTGIKRNTIQQQNTRKKYGIKVGGHIFIPFKKCEELKNSGPISARVEKLKEIEKFKELFDLVTVEELQEIIDERKKQMNKVA